MIGAGNLDRRITISMQGEPTGTDGAGHPIYGPPETFTVWARRIDVSDGERMAAGSVGGFRMARFVVRSSAQTRAIKPVHTLSHEGDEYNIIGVKETQDGRHRFLEITANMDADQ